MEKVRVYNLDAKEKDIIDKPEIFSMKARKDLILQGCEAFQSKNKQPQGRDPRAGLRNTAEGWGTGHGLSRAPRLKGSGYPTARNVGRVPFAKGGRTTHPIKAEKQLKKKINKKVRRLSIISAISASGNRELVERRGHLIKDVPEIPLVVDAKIQTIKTTGNIYSLLCDFGLKDELFKVKNSKKIRAGRGKTRGRKYKTKKGLLIVIKEDYGIVKASRNIPGTDIVKIDDLSIDNLAPGGEPGRMVLWTQSAFKDLNKYEAMI